MAPHERGGGCSRGSPGVEKVRLKATEEEKLMQPCFEGYLRGAWWEVEIKDVRSGMYLVRYLHLSEEESAWLPLIQLRLRARKCDEWDCFILRRGVDVGVYIKHPQTELLNLPPNKALYDAKITAVNKKKHELDCFCKFTVQFFCIKEESAPKNGTERTMLTEISTIRQVSIFKVSLLQQAGITPLHEVLKAHMSRKWRSDQGRWSNDAYFMKETVLHILKNSKGEESMTIPQGDVPTEVGSHEDQPEPFAGLGAKFGHQEGESKAHKSSAQVATPLRSETTGRAEPRKVTSSLDREERKTPAIEVRSSSRGTKRKHEKEIGNFNLNDQSPGLSSRFTRSNGKTATDAVLGTRKKDPKAGHKMSKGDSTYQKVEKSPADKKRIRLYVVESESPSRNSHSENSSERCVGIDTSCEGESSGAGVPKRGRTEEYDVGRKHQDQKSSKERMQRNSDLGIKSKVHGIGNQEKASDNKGGRLKEKELGRTHLEKVRKGSLSPKDPKQDKSERKSVSGSPDICCPVDNAEKVRGSGANELKDTCTPESAKDGQGKSKQGMESEEKDIVDPVGNVASTLKVKSSSGSEVNEADREISRKVGKSGEIEDLKLSAKAKVNRSSGKQQQVVIPVEGPYKKKLPIDCSEKLDQDIGCARKDVIISSSSPNFEDPASDPSPQLRKLRPRAGKSKKVSKPLFPSKSNNVSTFGQQKDAGKEKAAAEKFPDRPLYMDLLANNSEEEDGGNLGEVGVHIEEPKINFGLNDDWDPIGDEVLSDSECKILSEDPLMQEGVVEMLLTALQEDFQGGNTGKTDNEEGECLHDCYLKDDVGLVCNNCGLVSVPIEEMVPQVDCSQRCPREVDLDDWDFERSPNLTPEAGGYDKLESGNEVTMLNTCLPPHYAQAMHPHQKDGFEFLWRNLAYGEGKLRKRKMDKNAGCILSHAPGTGKSFLIISFLKSYMDKFPGSQPLIVAPKIMLRGWEKEFAHWKSDIKVFILNTAAVIGRRLIQKHEESGVISLKNHHPNSKLVDTFRMAMLYEWRKRRSVCLVSYNLFSSLTENKEGLKRTPDGELVRTALLEYPGILILDEGHFPRNKDTRIRKSLMRVKTNARILLSGTLFQNNFEELFNTLYLVRPGFVEAFSGCKLGGTSDTLLNEGDENSEVDLLDMDEVTGAAEKKARKLFVEEIGMKIEQEQLRKGSDELQHGLRRLQILTSDFVHHHTGEVLASLPGLRDFGILLKPTTLQCTLLNLVEKRFQKPEEYLKREIAVSETSIHPTLLTRLEFIKIDMSSSFREQKYGDLSVSQSDPFAMFKDLRDPEDGVKTKFVFDLLCLLKSTKEKVLIFSQHVSPLDLLEGMFKAAFNWDKKKDVLRLDGKLVMDERQVVIEHFNDPHSEARVLLASTKACGEGITLVGASRVVFLDVLWNPAVIKQAVSRAFRLGQKKTVYVYRLIAVDTIEEKKYKKAIQKDWLSQAIFCPTGGESEVCLDHPEDSGKGLEKPIQIGGLKKCSSNPDEILAWEVDAATCEDRLLEKLLETDKRQLNSFLKVIEHGSAFHNRKTSCGPDARDWFLEDGEHKDISHSKEKRVSEEPGVDSSGPGKVDANLYQDFGDPASSTDTDEEDL